MRPPSPAGSDSTGDGTIQTLRALGDLTRAHFIVIWPLLFCSGLLLALDTYGGFSFRTLILAAFIGLFGFEAGLVLNDYIDRNLDRRDVDGTLTRYWRPFHERPLPSGKITSEAALRLFLLLAAAAAVLIAFLPYPHSLYVAGIMAYSYAAESFYQVKKRDQTVPIAQVLGRTDFALFPVAGYLVAGSPDTTALLYFLFFYPWTLAHLAVNDLADITNDRAKGMATIPVLYGMSGAARWVLLFTVAHGLLAVIFAWALGPIAAGGFALGFTLLILANYRILSGKTAGAAMRALPLFHASLLIYIVAIITAAVVP
ncbi:UbiA family prenyltransferase [Methanoculleus taiwanensis]|uniref:UbiA family prenyltransferase n=1 Tax=Methanoculleus taiwanensis TaxID=1550565 RepID=UPI001F4F761A|nr:UbiA family prenyltransferase [Methanoculleus taiwanensis]